MKQLCELAPATIPIRWKSHGSGMLCLLKPNSACINASLCIKLTTDRGLKLAAHCSYSGELSVPSNFLSSYILRCHIAWLRLHPTTSFPPLLYPTATLLFHVSQTCHPQTLPSSNHLTTQAFYTVLHRDLHLSLQKLWPFLLYRPNKDNSYTRHHRDDLYNNSPHFQLAARSAAAFLCKPRSTRRLQTHVERGLMAKEVSWRKESHGEGGLMDPEAPGNFYTSMSVGIGRFSDRSSS